MKLLLALSLGLLLFASHAHAQNYADPCQDPRATKQSAAINIASATTTAVVAAVAAKIVYVCGFAASFAGTTPSAIFKYGTHASADCDTGAVSLSGTILPTSGVMVDLGYGGHTIFATAAGNQLCITTGGTPSVQGVLTYVQ